MNPAPFHMIRKSRRERRSTPRDRRILNGTMKYQGEFLPIEISDISEHGAYITAPTVPTLSDSVTIAVGLPTVGGSVMISGRVRRITLTSRAFQKLGGFGLEFTRFYTQVGRATLRDHLIA